VAAATTTEKRKIEPAKQKTPLWVALQTTISKR